MLMNSFPQMGLSDMYICYSPSEKKSEKKKREKKVRIVEEDNDEDGDSDGGQWKTVQRQKLTKEVGGCGISKLLTLYLVV